MRKEIRGLVAALAVFLTPCLAVAGQPNGATHRSQRATTTQHKKGHTRAHAQKAPKKTASAKHHRKSKTR